MVHGLEGERQLSHCKLEGMRGNAALRSTGNRAKDAAGEVLTTQRGNLSLVTQHPPKRLNAAVTGILGRDRQIPGRHLMLASAPGAHT